MHNKNIMYKKEYLKKMDSDSLMLKGVFILNKSKMKFKTRKLKESKELLKMSTDYMNTAIEKDSSNLKNRLTRLNYYISISRFYRDYLIDMIKEDIDFLAGNLNSLDNNTRSCYYYSLAELSALEGNEDNIITNLKKAIQVSPSSSYAQYSKIVLKLQNNNDKY